MNNHFSGIVIINLQRF